MGISWAGLETIAVDGDPSTSEYSLVEVLRSGATVSRPAREATRYSGLTMVDEASEDEKAWAEYLRTSPIMSNVPLTSHPSERIVRVMPPRLPVWNSSVRLMVAMPALWAVFNAAVGLLIGLWWWVLIATFVVATLASVFLAIGDQRMLHSDGHDETVSPLWAFAPFVYLWRRGTLLYRVNAAGFRPFWAYLCVIAGLLLALFFVVVWGGAVIKLAETRVLLGI